MSDYAVRPVAIHPAEMLAASINTKIAAARTDGFIDGYAAGRMDERRTLSPLVGVAFCLGITFGGIGVVILARLSA